MAFTYDLTTDRGKVRFEVGDYAETSGIRPAGQNFTDEEVDYALDQEGDSVMKAVARLCEALSREYSAYAGIQLLDGHSEQYRMISSAFAKRASELREQYGAEQGATTQASRVYSGSFTRISGYSDDIASNEV